MVVSQYPWQVDNSWILLTNLDSNLNLHWQRYYGGDAFYHLWGLKATPDEGCVIYAERYDENTQDEEYDMYILKVDTNGLLTSLNDSKFIIPQGMLIYPNPANSFVRISSPWLNQTGQKDIIITNSMGIEVKKMEFSALQESVEINISNLPSGLYFISIYKDGRRMVTGKAVVNR